MVKITTMSSDELDHRIQKNVEKKLLEILPKILREANQKEYLNTRDVRDQFSISYRSQQYLRDSKQIPFSQDGRRILYNRVDILRWLENRRLNRRKNDEN